MTARSLAVCLPCVLAGACSSPTNPSATVGRTGIEASPLVVLRGNTHPLANAEHDLGAVADGFALDHMQLVLKRSPEREAEAAAYVDALHDPKSPLFHQWLTAEQYGEKFGLTPADVSTVSQWLTSNGFRVDSVPPSRMFIEFSGSAGQVRNAFHTEIHRLSAHGETHFGNTSDPSIPAALSDRVAGVFALHDFKPHPLHHDLGPAQRDARTGKWNLGRAIPSFNVNPDGGGTFFAVAPADFATIYNLNPLFNLGYRGTGQTIVVVEDTLLKNTSDVSTFRSAFGLTGGSFSQVSPTGSTTCSSPGVNGAEGEAALDAEWASAAAPGATVTLAGCKDTSTLFGGLIAVENLINGATPPPIISMSYGECEADDGSAANQSFITTFQQAASEGVSMFVSAGDEGAASCDANQATAANGIAVSGWASTPYNVAVGGTDFMDTYDSLFGGPAFSTYWSATNGTAFSSALSYVPEIPWNDGCTSALIYDAGGFAQGYGATGFCNSDAGAPFITTGSGSGGPSTVSSQPSWQTGVVGLPTQSGGMRYLPDVSLFAANGVWGHFYVFCMTDTAQGGGPCNYTDGDDAVALAAGGTSFASPALAGIQALVNEFTGSKQGNPNTTYYRLAAAEYGLTGNANCNSSGGSVASPRLPDAGCVFQDVTQGDIDVPCTGTLDCFGSSGGLIGALSTSSTSFGSAYPAGNGWDFATGLGTVNATNLVTAWAGNVCNISGVFYDAGSVEPGDSCGTCVPGTSPFAWSGVPNGTSCNDGNPCTTSDSCQSGVCTGTAVVCTPLDACHVSGTCNTGTGMCSNPEAQNGTTCGEGGTCQSGVCTVATTDAGTRDGGGTAQDGGGTQSCSDGCVDKEGTCRPGTAASWCGSGGNACVGCAMGQECSNGTCIPQPSGCGCAAGVDSEMTALLFAAVAATLRGRKRRSLLR